MKEQLISFETARLAKEKGFDWKCYWFCTYKRKIATNKQSFYPDLGEYKDFNNLKNNFYEYFSLPTQSLLQKWLRDEHKIFINMQVGGFIQNKQTYYCNVLIFGKNLYKSKFRSNTSVYNFEQALEIGLQEGLKLIKT